MSRFARRILADANPISFWSLHIVGWLAFVAVHYFQMELLMAPGQFFWVRSLIFYVSFLIFLTIQRYFFMYLPYRNYSILKLILVIFLMAFGLSAARTLSGNYLLAVINGTAGSYFKSIKYSYMFQSIFTNSMVFMGWSGLYFGIKFLIEWNEQKEQTQKAFTLAQKAQLQMLRYQINPHFLFNSLNSIRALITENKANAKGMITELAEFLRYSLLSENYIAVPLNQEIAAIRHYYAIEKRRFESKLDIEFAIDPGTSDIPIISFLIHPLVENAIKYGMRTSSMPVKIQLRVELMDDRLRVAVQNSGHWIEPPQEAKRLEDSTGTGLQNVRHRLQSAYPNQHTFTIDKKADSVCVCFEIFQKGNSNEKHL